MNYGNCIRKPNTETEYGNRIRKSNPISKPNMKIRRGAQIPLFSKGDTVVVVKGDLMDLMGKVLRVRQVRNNFK